VNRGGRRLSGQGFQRRQRGLRISLGQRQQLGPIGPFSVYQTVAHDPEADDYEPAEPERALIPGRMLTR
jgi:hypothetical protein